ncbi:MAG: hypothetical protein J7L15_04175 [Clostridiales bacterium]|nr:hypothetical protein [Clostridiales bacterium]
MESIRERISEYNEEAILFDDLDDAIIGIGCQHGSHYVAIYSKRKCLNILEAQFMTNENEITSEEDPSQMAIEWFDFNIECLYAGKNTPIILIDDFKD